MTPREIDRIKCAIRHIKSSLDVDPWAVEIAVDAMKAQLSREDTTSDLISRQDALSFLRNWERVKDYSWGERNIIKATINEIESLPSAQPEIVRCKDCKHHWIHRCMDSMPTEICDLDQTFYDPYIDFCSLAERRTDE